MSDKDGTISKRRKVSAENRSFKQEWTETFAFVLPPGTVKPMCLICRETLSVCKGSNLRRHYTTKHAHFEETYPPTTELRSLMIEQLKSAQEIPKVPVVHAMTRQEKAMECSLRVAWVLGKHIKPFTDAHMVKECMCEITEALFHGEEKDEMKAIIRQIPLSDSTAIRRTEMISDDLVSQLYAGMKQAPCIALAMDESMDYTDDPQLLVFVRYYDETQKGFIEDLLDVMNLGGRTCEDVYQSIKIMLRKQGIDVKSIISVTTNGVVSMVGGGLVEPLRVDHPGVLSYHCVVQQSATCASLQEQYAEAVENVTNLVSFLKTSSIKHPSVSGLVSDAQNSDTTLQGGVRWLAKARLLERLWLVRHDVLNVLKQQMNSKANVFAEYLENYQKMETVAFLADITSYLIELNVKFQEEKNTIFTLMTAIKSFHKRLELYRVDIIQGELIHFPKLAEHIHFPKLSEHSVKGYEVHDSHLEFINKLLCIFEMCFNDFTLGENMQLFLENPFLVTDLTAFKNEVKQVFDWVDPAVLQMEMIELQGNVALKHHAETCDPLTFWTRRVFNSLCPQLVCVAMHLLTVFSSGKCFRSALTTLTSMKNKCRYRINTERIHQCLRLSLTPLTPAFKELAQSRQCQVSH